MKFPVVNANIDFSKSTDLAGKVSPTTILTVADQKIGIIGLVTPDPAIEGILTTLAEPIATLKETPVGESSVFLVGDRAVCRIEECNLGDLLPDAMRAETGAQIAIENGGGIRSNVPVGIDTPADLALSTPMQVMLGDVLTILPFGNLTSSFKLKGSDVVAALENGVSQVEVRGRTLPAGFRSAFHLGR